MDLKDLTNQLEIAKKAAIESGKFLLKNKKKINKKLEANLKDIKLEADIHSETLIKEIINKESNYSILAEESGKSEEDLGDTFWVIDPLDGTANYNRDIPICCVSIALIHAGDPVLGVIYDFNHDDMYSGSINHKAKLNNNEINVSDIADKSKGTLVTGLPAQTDFSDSAIQKMIGDFQSWKKIRMIGSAAMAAVYVASGKADLYKEYGIYLWDIAAGAAIVKAAGGHISLLNHNDMHQVDAFFSNTYLENEHGR